MSYQINEVLKLSAAIFRSNVPDMSLLRNTIIKCNGLLIANKIIDETGRFTRLLDLDREIELKKIVELLGYCYFLVKDTPNAYKVYQALVLSDDTPFNPWDEDIPPRKVIGFYRSLRNFHIKIIQLQKEEASLKEKKIKKTSERHKEFYSLYFSLGYYSLAAEQLEKYLQEEPQDFEHWYLLAEYYEYKENYPRAIMCVENAFKYALSEGYTNEADGYREKLAELRNLQ